MPSWRDFERTIAFVLGGQAQESKEIFDVILPSGVLGIKYGISCKMRRELNRIDKLGRVAVEVSNAARELG